jgi:hypothetical protein
MIVRRLISRLELTKVLYMAGEMASKMACLSADGGDCGGATSSAGHFPSLLDLHHVFYMVYIKTVLLKV